MKQRFLLSLLFVCSLAIKTRAQINKGATWLGGQAGYSQSSEGGVSSNFKNKQSSFNISPAVGTAVKDNLVVGISASYAHSKFKTGGNLMNKQNYYGGGVFIRKYIPVVSRLYIFGDAKVFFNAFRTDENISTNPNKIKGWNVGISATPGLSYAITDKIQIETGVNSLFSTTYEKKNQKQGVNEAKSSSFNTGVFLSNTSPLFIGFRFLLNKKA